MEIIVSIEFCRFNQSIVVILSNKSEAHHRQISPNCNSIKQNRVEFNKKSKQKLMKLKIQQKFFLKNWEKWKKSQSYKNAIGHKIIDKITIAEQFFL